jgi:hypothetical protein
MKFCPLCKKDYNDEETHCPECGKELLNGIYTENAVIFDYSREDLVLKLFNHLCERGFQTIQYYYDDQEELYCLTADAEENMAAKQEMLLYIDADNTSGDAPSDYEKNAIAERLSSAIESMVPDEGAKTYINAKDKYEDVMSSATSLLVVSVLGFIFVGLVYFQIITLNMNPLFYVLSTTMFLGFFILGIISFQKAMKIKSFIPSEDILASDIKEFFLNDLDITALEDNLKSSSLSEEEKYFSRNEFMKAAAKNKFENADELLIEGMIEEVYGKIFPN